MMEWSVTEQGPRATVEVRCRDKGDGLYKAYAKGVQGCCLLGTLLPENGWLYLKRTVTVEELRRNGVWPVKGVECRMIHSFQKQPQSIPWADEVLRHSARSLPGHTVHRVGEGFSLVTRFDPRLPFPLVPLFCLSRVEGERLIFSFRKDGTPYISGTDGNDR